jgi:hypothetical protein
MRGYLPNYMLINKFEVKTGKNAGYYLVVDTWKNCNKYFPKWGGLVEEYNYNFYKYHNALGKFILTHSKWAKHVMKSEYIKAK